MEYKAETVRAYDAHARALDGTFEGSFQRIGKPVVDLFLSMLPPGAPVLDIGSGTGNKAAYVQAQGHPVVCVDLSPEMVRLCKEKGLRAHVMDLEDLRVEHNSFEGVVAYTSLLHVPKKNFPNALDNLKRILSPTGHVLFAMKEGAGEGLNGDDEVMRRWFSYYTDDELRQYMQRSFTVVHHDRVAAGKSVFLHYILKGNDG